MPQITRRLEFDYGHRVLGHEGRCRHLHGHRGVVLITVNGLGLDKVGRVVDFSVVKSVVGKWIDDHLDHNFLCHPDDPILKDWYGNSPLPEVFAGKHPFVMPNGNPTAENIAEMIFDKARELLNSRGLSVSKVKVFETPNCSATYEG